MSHSPRGLVPAAATLSVAAATLTTNPAAAGEWDFQAEVAGELRTFVEAPQFDQQEDTRLSPSVAVELEWVYETDSGDDRFTLTPFARLDADDDKRTHADLRAANWLHFGDGWDLVVGLDKVFWGVTESRHLVDIVNQDDAVEDIDGEDKLGQPMINLNVEIEDLGILDGSTASLFVLPGFRKRTFVDDDARLRGPLPISDDAQFESGARERHVDFAARWTQTFDDLDVGISHFHGTSREPRLVPRTTDAGNTELVPFYDQIDQTGLDLQLTTDATLWKFEGISRSGHGDQFFAFVGGFEHTLFGVFESDADLGLLAEYLWDDRDPADAPPALTDNDVFLGTRLALNDEPDTQALAGTIVDVETGSMLWTLEAERRIGADWRAEVEARLFANVSSDDEAAGFRDDGFVTFRLTRFF